MIEYKSLDQAMRMATSQTLENMAFTEAKDHYDQNYEIPADELVWSYLMINDPLQGEIRLALSKTTLMELTTAIFGLDESEVTPAQEQDILNEILNTIAGLFMTNLLPANQQFKIGLPERGEEPLPEVDPDTIAWRMMTGEENPFQIYVAGSTFATLEN